MRRVIAIVGPTASGKTGLSIELAQRFGGEIVGVDASQLYQGFNIGTGKATREELRGVKHHNIDVAQPSDAFDAARFTRQTINIVEDVFSRGSVPVICGGTGLYFRALRNGLCQAPKVPPSVQDEVLKEMDDLGIGVVYSKLLQVDSESAKRIHFNDRQRIERAISVYRHTGKTLTEWMATTSFPGLDAAWYIVGLRWPPELLKQRIEQRVRHMFNLGWLEEVEGLVRQGHHKALRAFTAIGYRLILDVLEGRCSREEGEAEIVRQTQKYAKRQMTWFRKEADVNWFDCPVDISVLNREIHRFLGGDIDHCN